MLLQRGRRTRIDRTINQCHTTRQDLEPEKSVIIRRSVNI